jgi:hypothetical protein
MEKEDSKRDLGEVDDTGLKLRSIDTLAQLCFCASKTPA